MSNSKGSILISNANAVGTALVNKLGGTGYTPNEWSDKINLLGIADADIPTALAGITEGSYSGEDRGAIKICNANNVGTMLNKKFNTNRGFKPSEWESAISKLTALTTGTASGSVVTFSDGADDVPVVNCIASVDPVQDLHGYSKPWAPGCGKNLFDKDHPNEVDGYITTVGFSTANVKAKTIYIPIIGGNTYTVSKNAGQRFQIATAEVIPSNDALFTSRQSDNTATSLTITASANDKYLWAWVFLEDTDTGTLTEMLASIQIEVGSSATTYEPYSNICPISGSTETTVYQFGKNLVDGYVDFSVNNKIVEPRYYKAGTYTLSCVRSTNLNGMYVRKGSVIDLTAEILISKFNTLTITFTITEPGYYFIQLYRSTISPTWEDEPLSNVMVEIGSTATAYEPYKAKTPINIQFNQTVYGADVDAKSGNNNIMYGIITLNGSETSWSAYTTGNGYAIALTGMKRGTYYLDPRALCDKLPKVAYNSSLGVRIGVANDGLYVVQANTIPGVTDLTSFKTWLSNNPITVTYPLDTPQPFTTDPNDISTYKNNNVFYNTTGDTSVTYYKGV